MCILVLAPFGTSFASILDYALFWRYLGQIFIKSGAYLALKILKIGAKTSPSNGAIWDEFSEQRYHQIIKKHQFYSSISTFSMQIRCKFNAQFGWVIGLDHFYWNGTNKLFRLGRRKKFL